MSSYKLEPGQEFCTGSSFAFLVDDFAARDARIQYPDAHLNYPFVVVEGADNRQTWTTQGQYWYGANGMRARSFESGVDTRYVYLGHDPVYEISGSVQTDYVYINGKLKAKMTGSDTFYYFTDALGSTRVVRKDETTKAATTPAVRVLSYKPFEVPVA